MNIVVTGASKGIGKAIVEQFAQDKMPHQFFICARNTEELQKLKSSVETNSPQQVVQIFSCDVSKKEDVKKFADFILNITQLIDIVINNAGNYLPGSCYNEPDGTLEKMLNVNLFSAYYLTRFLVQSMIENKKGQIINICSIASLKAYDNGGSYSISKYALMGFTKNLREELKSMNIKVSAIYPGATMTDSWNGTGVDEKRIMEVNDVAKMVHASAYLSPQAVMEDIVLRPQLGDL